MRDNLFNVGFYKSMPVAHGIFPIIDGGLQNHLSCAIVKKLAIADRDLPQHGGFICKLPAAKF